MPAFLTHWRVLIETAQRSQDAGSDLGSLIIDMSSLRRRLSGMATPPQTTPAGAVWDTGPLPTIDYRFPGSDISSMAFLGALGPDLFAYRRGHFRSLTHDASRGTEKYQAPEDKISWETLLHTKRSGDMLLTFLEQIAHVPSPALRSQALAYAVGYTSHIATDIAFHPWTHALATLYTPADIPGLLAPSGMRFYIATCLDEYLATTYFHHPLYTWFQNPWSGYIEPAVHSLTEPLGSAITQLLASAAESTYKLTPEQSQSFHSSLLAGLQSSRHYLSGRGRFRGLTLQASLRNRKNDPIFAVIAAPTHTQDIWPYDEVMQYAIRLSEHFCRRVISYYVALRNPQTAAQERSQRRTALYNDLRNWDLLTGYRLEMLFDQQITVRLLHNWIHFADLWGSTRENSGEFGRDLAARQTWTAATGNPDSDSEQC